MNNHADKPWWTDGDKVASIVATTGVLCIALLILSITVRICIWIITGQW